MQYTRSVSGRTIWMISEGCLSERGEFGAVNRSAVDTEKLLDFLVLHQDEIRVAAAKELRKDLEIPLFREEGELEGA